MSLSWQAALPVQDAVPGTMVLRRIGRWLRGLVNHRHRQHFMAPVGEISLPYCEPGSWATAADLPWWADLDAEPVRIWPELDLLPVDRFIDRLFAPLERQWAA